MSHREDAGRRNNAVIDVELLAWHVMEDVRPVAHQLIELLAIAASASKSNPSESIAAEFFTIFRICQPTAVNAASINVTKTNIDGATAPLNA